jgi:exodeoxyribonuclease VII large subunit
VGHETDFTIADFVADLRAPTPSAAAAAVVPDRLELLGQVRGMMVRLTELLDGRLEMLWEQLDAQERLLRMHDQRRVLAEQRQRIDDLMRRGTHAVIHQLELMRTQLVGADANLRNLNPLYVLRRGYSVVEDADTETMIESVGQTYPGQRLWIHLQDGSVDAQVTSPQSGD